MKSIVYCLFLVISFFSCNKDLEFEKIEHEVIYRKSRPEHTLKYLSESWIVHNYKDNKENEARIDSFVCAYVDTINRPYSFLSVAFFKYSKTYTNMETLTRRPDNISESMAHDYLWEYTFNRAGFKGKYKLKNLKNREFFFSEPVCLVMSDSLSREGKQGD